MTPNIIIYVASTYLDGLEAKVIHRYKEAGYFPQIYYGRWSTSIELGPNAVIVGEGFVGRPCVSISCSTSFGKRDGLAIKRYFTDIYHGVDPGRITRSLSKFVWPPLPQTFLGGTNEGEYTDLGNGRMRVGITQGGEREEEVNANIEKARVQLEVLAQTGWVKESWGDKVVV